MNRTLKALIIITLFTLALSPLICGQEKQESKPAKDDGKVITWSSGDIYIQAENIDTIRPGVRVATGYVEVFFLGQHLQADEVVHDTNTGIIEATGNVAFDSSDASIACRKMEAYRDGTGKFFEALIYAGEYIIRSELLQKQKDGTYEIEGAVITPCTQINPCWSFRASSGKIKVGDYVFIKGITFRIKGIPAMWIPAFYLPLDEETGRTTGFLFPAIGSSSIYGTSYSEAFFWAISRSVDATITANYYTEKGLGLGFETRYRLDRRSGGLIRGTYLKEKDTDSVRWTLNANHRQTILGWNLAVSGNLASDISYNQDYLNNLNQISSRSSSYMNARLSRRVGPFSLNVDGRYTENIFQEDNKNIRAYLPSATIGLKPMKLFGTPVYFSMSGNFANLYRKTSSEEIDYYRFDFLPTIKATYAGIPWLKVSPTFQYRYTYYSESRDPEINQYSEEALWREYYNLNVRLVGPTFSRVYLTPEFDYAEKFKHIIEPTIIYNYVSEPNDIDRIIRFDGLDYARPVHELRIGLVNKVLARQKLGNDKYKVREILTWGLSQHISLDDSLKTSFGSQYNRFFDDGVVSLSPLVSTFRFRPTDNLSLTNRIEYNHDFEQIASLYLMLNWRHGDIFTDIKWMKTFDLEQTRTPSDQLTTVGGFSVFDRLFDINYSLSYDLIQDTLWRGNVQLRYNHQCFSLIAAYDHFEIGTRVESRVTFNVELTGISGMLSQD